MAPDQQQVPADLGHPGACPSGEDASWALHPPGDGAP